MGRIGLVHLEAITKAPGVTPVMISNPTISKAEAAAKQYNVPRFTNDAMEVITDPDGTITDAFLEYLFHRLCLPQPTSTKVLTPKFLNTFLKNKCSRCGMDLQSQFIPCRTNQGVCSQQ